MPLELLSRGAGAGAIAALGAAPAYVTASPLALAKARRIAARARTRAIVLSYVGDSNSAGYVNTGILRWADAPAQVLDRGLALLRAPAASPYQTVVVKPVSPGAAPVNNLADAPHSPAVVNADARWWGNAGVVVGVSRFPHTCAGGYITPVPVGHAEPQRKGGFVVDTRATGKDWERNKRRVSVVHSAGHDVENAPVGGSLNLTGGPNAANYPGGVHGSLLIEVVDVTGEPPANWATKAPIRSVTVGCVAGYFTLSGVRTAPIALDADKRQLLRFSAVGQGIGACIEALVLGDGTASGVEVYDHSFTGAAYADVTRTVRNADGTPNAGLYPQQITTQLGAYASKIGGMFGNPMGAPGHVAPGLDLAVVALNINDYDDPVATPAMAREILGEIAGVFDGFTGDDEKLLVVHLPPCYGDGPGDTAAARDSAYLGTNGYPRYADFRSEIKRAAAAFPASVVVVDHQERLGDRAPSVLKTVLGIYGTNGAGPGYAFDGKHFRAAAYQNLVAETTAELLYAWGANAPDPVSVGPAVLARETFGGSGLLGDADADAGGPYSGGLVLDQVGGGYGRFAGGGTARTFAPAIGDGVLTFKAYCAGFTPGTGGFTHCRSLDGGTEYIPRFDWNGGGYNFVVYKVVAGQGVTMAQSFYAFPGVGQTLFFRYRKEGGLLTVESSPNGVDYWTPRIGMNDASPLPAGLFGFRADQAWDAGQGVLIGDVRLSALG